MAAFIQPGSQQPNADTKNIKIGQHLNVEEKVNRNNTPMRYRTPREQEGSNNIKTIIFFFDYSWSLRQNITLTFLKFLLSGKV